MTAARFFEHHSANPILEPILIYPSIGGLPPEWQLLHIITTASLYLIVECFPINVETECFEKVQIESTAK